jgi:hypothetical protein
MNPPSMQQPLRKIRKSRFGLSAVVTTLIILVIAVLLAGAVSYFAINVTSTRVQQESLSLQRQHVWYNVDSQSAQAAIMVINAGGRDAVIAKATVRGQTHDWNTVFYTTTTDSLGKDLPYCDSLEDGAKITVGGKEYTLHQAANVVTVETGKTLILYISNPDSISAADVGLTVSINLFTSEAMYYKEANVQ